MFCPACGTSVVDDAVYCTACGARFEAECSACGTRNPTGAKFCKQCGARLEAAAPQVPAHLREKILAERSRLAGERKQVTVLFADVRGSMDLQEALDPEEWRGIMDGFYGVLSAGVHAYEGIVNTFTGDGIMALFGAPIAHEDHAQRACHAALQLCEDVQQYAHELHESRGLEFAVRLGLNSGEVVVGGIGDDLRMEYTALGHTVGLAQRMEAAAEPGTAYLSEHTAHLVEGFFDLADLGAQTIKGVQEPLHVFKLRGVGPAHTRLDVARARGLSKFVGRDGEMRTLHEALDRARSGDGNVVGVVALAGTGKSRLCYEFTEQCRGEGLPVHEAHGLAHGTESAYLPMLEFLRNFFGIAGQDTPEQARTKVTDLLLRIDPQLDEALPLMYEFLGVPDPERPLPQMDPDARQRHLFGLVQRVTQGARQAGVIWLEDLHWFDQASRGMLDALVEAVPGSKALLLVSFRPEFEAEWMRQTTYEQIGLHPLRPEASAELLADLLGTDPSLNGVPQVIRDHTGGNPFFIEEAVQDLAEHGSLAGERGAYTLTRSIEELAIPATVQAVLDARIDRLPEGEKQVLQTAAVVGRTFPAPVLRHVLETTPDLEAMLQALTAMEFLYKTGVFPEAEYTFKHALTQEVAYHSQLSDRRRHIHAAVAQAIETLYPDALDEHAALLAHHYERGGENLAAARWHARAAQWTGGNDLPEGFHHWRRVLAVLEPLTQSQETIALGLEARIRMLSWGARVGLAEAEGAELFAATRALAEQTGDARILSGVLMAYAGSRLMCAGDLRGVGEMLTQGLRLAEAAGDVEMQAANHAALALADWASGRLHQALRRVQCGLELGRDDPMFGARVLGFSVTIWFTQFRGSLAAWTGHLDEAALWGERAAALAREHHDMENLDWSNVPVLYAAWFQGDREKVSRYARRKAEMAEKIGSVASRVYSHAWLGLAHSLAQQGGSAIAALEQARHLAREKSAGREREPEYVTWLAQAYLGAQDIDRAYATAEEALALAKERGALTFEIEAQLVVARVLLHGDGSAAQEQIRAALQRAKSLVKETGAAVLEPFTRVEFAKLARLTGDVAGWERELREAHRLFIEIGAPIRAQQVEELLQGVA